MTNIWCGKKCWWKENGRCTKSIISIKHDSGQCMDFVELEEKIINTQFQNKTHVINELKRRFPKK